MNKKEEQFLKDITLKAFGGEKGVEKVVKEALESKPFIDVREVKTKGSKVEE